MCLSCNTFRPVQNGKCFLSISKCILLKQKCSILIVISLNFVPKGSVDDKSALAQLGTEQMTSHYPNQGWVRSLITFGITKPHWVDNIIVVKWYNSEVFHHITKNLELLWYQLCCHRQHGTLLFWQPMVPPVIVKFGMMTTLIDCIFTICGSHLQSYTCYQGWF